MHSLCNVRIGKAYMSL